MDKIISETNTTFSPFHRISVVAIISRVATTRSVSEAVIGTGRVHRSFRLESVVLSVVNERVFCKTADSTEMPFEVMVWWA